MLDVMSNPQADAATLETLKAITLKSREDAKKEPTSIARALSTYNRYGDESSYLNMLTTDEINALTVDELLAGIEELLGYKQTIMYTGSLPLADVQEVLKRHHPLEGSLKDTPEYRFKYARDFDQTEIYFFDKELAQANVRIEFPDGKYDESKRLPIELYNGYFAGGMSGIVFQELREARALAYSAGALYFKGSRVNDENIMVGAIGCQADKTVEAVDAFLDLFDNLPESPERFNETVTGTLNLYRTSPIGFRSVIGTVRSWERLGLTEDPRERVFNELQDAELADLMNFHANHIKGKPKLISIVGDKNRIDMEALGKFGKIIEISLDDIFVD